MEHKTLINPIIVGRERELKELRRCLELVLIGKGTTVFVSAEAGVGKSRLINEFTEFAMQEIGVIRLAGWCLFKAEVPYFPFIEAFNSYFSTLSAKSNKEELELNLYLKGSPNNTEARMLSYPSPQTLKDQTFSTVVKTLHTIASQHPVILVIEDVQWADSASLALIHYVSRAINGSERILVLATFRSEELTNDADGYPHPLVETLCMMRREELFKEINLVGLNDVCITLMAENMLGGNLQPEFAEKLADESKGNPLFIVESLRMLHENNSIVQENNEWRLKVDKIGIPSKIKDIIRRRLSRLNYAQRRILDAASVIGEEFEVKLLSEVVGQDTLEVLETLNTVAHSTSLVQVDENRYRFDHARSRETIYAVLAAPLKRGYHNRIAEILESSKGAALPLSNLAYHYAEAGSKEKAVKYALAAAKDDLARWSIAQAIKHFEYVLLNADEGYGVENRSALEGLGDAYAASSRFGDAIKTFDKLALAETGTARLRAFRKAMDAAYAQGDKPDLLLEYARKAEELGVDDRLEMARILSNRGKAHGWGGRGDVKQDLADYNAALQMFEDENSFVDIAEALLRSGQVAAIFFDDLRKKGLAQLLRSNAMFRELGDVRKEIEVTRWTGTSLNISGLAKEAGREYASVLRLGEKLGVFAELAQATMYLGESYEKEGKLADALTKTLTALEYCRRTDANWLEGYIYVYLIRQYSLLGDLKLADEYYDKMSRMPPEVLSNLNILLVFPMAKGVYFAAKSRWKESTEWFEKSLEIIEKLRFQGYEGNVRRNYAWALERQGCFEEAKVQHDKIQKSLQQVENKFGRGDVQLGLLLPRNVYVGKEFEVRIDLVNVSRSPVTLIRVEGLNPSGITFISMPSFCRIQNNSLAMNQKEVGPFQVETLKLRAIFAKTGIHQLEPSVSYVDDQGESRQAKTGPVTVRIAPDFTLRNIEVEAEPLRGKFEFKSEAAEKAFNFLIRAFNEDCVSRKQSEEKSGWRTLMEITRSAHVTMHSMYGRGGRGGKAMLELERMGLVESRVFEGERGRGGQVLKIRIRCGNENVKQRIDEGRDK